MLEVSFRDEGTYLLVTCRGDWEPDDVRDALVSMRDEAGRTGHTRILVDWRGVSAPRSEFHRFEAGRDVAEILRPPLRVATLGRPEVINRFAENAAVNRGASMFVSADEMRLRRWLLGDSVEVNGA
jgi:hypothetical protein